MVNNKGFLTFENILKISFPLLIVLGIVNLTSYYYQFNLPILEYLNFSEIITLFLDNIIYYLFLLFPLFAVVFALKEDASTPVLWALGIIFLFIVIIVFINGDVIFGESNAHLLLPFLIIYSPAFIFVVVFKKSKIIKDRDVSVINYHYILSVFLFVGALMVTSIIGMDKARDVKVYHVFNGTKITVDGNILTSNDSTYFIGKTEHFLFLYDEQNGTPIIFPIDRVSKIALKGKKPPQRGGDHPVNPPNNP